jgi:hypothetical protein
MMMRMGKFWLVLLLAVASAAAAQDNICPALVRAAYSAARLECSSLAPGEACYGNRPVDVTALDTGSFSRPGHRISGVQALQSGTMRPEAGEWGVAELSIAGNTPGQTVTMIVFGAVALHDVSGQSAPVNTLPARVSFPGGTNLRALPAEDADIVAPLLAGQIVPATGRLDDNSWFRLFLDAERSGWARADVIRVQGDLDWIPVVTADDPATESLYGPLQALEFSSTEQDALCAEAPDSGILLQAAQPVSMSINGADVQFDGTIYLQAPREMTVHVLEGSAQITSGGETQTASAGRRIRVRYDTTAQALGAPRAPEDYFYVRMIALPLDLLPREIPQPAFNLLGVVTPAVPNQPVLQGLIEQSPCTAAALNEVRLRQGPGREYAIQGALYANETARPDGKAIGSDGMLWLRLAPGVWVRDDIVLTAGACADLPTVPAPPVGTETP